MLKGASTFSSRVLQLPSTENLFWIDTKDQEEEIAHLHDLPTAQFYTHYKKKYSLILTLDVALQLIACLLIILESWASIDFLSNKETQNDAFFL